MDGVAHTAGHVERGCVPRPQVFDRALAGEEPDQFDEEEGVSVGAVVQRRRQPRIGCGGSGGELEITLDVGLVEAAQGEAFGVSLAGERPQ